MITRLSKRSRLLLAGILIGLLAALPVIAQQTGDQPTKAPALGGIEADADSATAAHDGTG